VSVDLCYPACKAHAPYFIVVCGLSGCTCRINGTISGGGGGELLNMKCVSCSLQRLSETFLILRRTERDVIINVKYLCKVRGTRVRF
jgi:hypothetical protein